MKIGARLLPLSGKYYGTKIEVVWESEKTELSIWKMGDYIPSTRQLEYLECTYQEAKEDDLMCDSHYETAYTYNLASEIVKRILAGN